MTFKPVRWALACLLTVGFALAGRAAEAPVLKADHREEVEKELIKVEHTLNEAFKARDKAALEALCSEDFLFSEVDGKPMGRAKFIEAATGNIKVSDYRESDLVARSYGDTGVVTGVWKGKVTVDNTNSDVNVRFTDTFVRRSGHWWAIAGTMTKLGDDVN